MKISDDYDAKIELWARECKVHPLPGIPIVPRFKGKKFNSYEEMNTWKRQLLDQIASQGGLKWTK